VKIRKEDNLSQEEEEDLQNSKISDQKMKTIMKNQEIINLNIRKIMTKLFLLEI